MKMLLSRSRAPAWSWLNRAFGYAERTRPIAAPPPLPTSADRACAGQPAPAGTPCAAETARHPRPQLAWRVVEVADGRLEWRVAGEDAVAAPMEQTRVTNSAGGRAA